ncbi:MAG: hypothetical protein WCQ21_24765 [Verrucomicrobiota bacterium]
MRIRSVTRAGLNLKCSCGYWRWLPPAIVAAVVVGCTSTEIARKEPAPRADFIEYRHIVVQANGHVDAAMHALDEISSQAHRDPRPAYAAFAKAVHRLEVDSIKVRARTQAMRARGDAYFEHWQAYLGTVKNEQVRKLAEEHQSELKQSFEEAQLASKQVREVFRPFLSDLQRLRAVLEAEPSLARISAQKGLILAAKDKGRQVQQGLDRILVEMNSMTAMLRPPGTALKP